MEEAVSAKMELEDRLIPYNDRKFVLRKLLRLPLTALGHLVIHWASKYGVESRSGFARIQASVETLQKRRVKRRILATRIILDYWPRGMYLYQLAQIDCYLLVHRPSLHYWASSTAWNAKNEKQIMHLDFDNFVQRLKEDLQTLYLCNVHSFKHPEMPLLICRVQLFDHSNKFRADPARSLDGSSSLNAPIEHQLISRSPYYIAFPLNSPNIIHSPDEDSYAKLILQSVQKIYSEREPVMLRPNQTIAVRSLEALQILQGASRHSSALGPWACYAGVSFEISPLGKIERHESMRGRRVLSSSGDLPDDSLPEAKRLRHEKAMVRFKGSREGVMKRKAYETKRFIQRIHNPDKEPSASADESEINISKYSSLIPVEKVEFTLTKDLSPASRQVSVRFKFRGKDVFGGLHELCDKELIQVEKVPGWLAGENGADSGTIINGEFINCTQKGGLL
ncbi:hypothetical protein HG536_0H01490 [Torulaspora globosa]|uniref:HORMA domain-containing protein n=1 Tax=Torulaspora globosa TaxID=48254 RepID=A0A7G3ZMN8_9SACH|nr:uncharacterized protein HG536_0H01490 [Torulaspora globosa]QLL34774.1 hypothetical protein HG536_0H01490 [Torulaspora globosa]